MSGLKQVFAGVKNVGTEDPDKKTPEQLAAEQAAREEQDRLAAEEAARLAAEAAADGNPGGGEEEEEEEEEEEPEGGAGGNGGEGNNGDDNATTVVGFLHSLIGAQEINPEGLDDNEEGLTTYINNVLPVIKSKAVQELLEKDPDLKELYEHKAKGGTVETWKKAKQDFNTWSSVTFKDDNDIETAKKVMTASLKLAGLDDTVIQTVLETQEDKKVLIPNAKAKLQELQEKEKTIKATLLQREIEEAKLAEEEARKEWEAIKNVIKTGKLTDNIVIPALQRTEFEEFISKPVDPKRGVTARDEAFAKLSIEQSLYIDYILFNLIKGQKNVGSKKPTAKFVLKTSAVQKDLGGKGGGDKADFPEDGLFKAIKGSFKKR